MPIELPPSKSLERIVPVVKDEIKKAVHAYILDQFLPGEDPNELQDQTPLITGGILDSITTLRLVDFLEQSFNIVVAAHEAGRDNLDSIERIADFVSRKTTTS